MTLLLPDVTIRPDTVHHLDCFRLMNALPDRSVDAITTDMPYGTTYCAWDTRVDLAAWWAVVKRVLKPRGVFVTTASQPFTSALVMSNPKWFKYSWVWIKTKATFFQHAANAPLRRHEDVLVFSSSGVNHKSLSSNRMNYFPQMVKGEPWKRFQRTPNVGGAGIYKASKSNVEFVGTTNCSPDGWRYPSDVIEDMPKGNFEDSHPTQKPIALFEYLIKTYTLPGDLILDPFCGSGTTAVAARNLGRHYIAGDITAEYVEVARKRLAQPYTPPMFPEVAAPKEELPVQLNLTGD